MEEAAEQAAWTGLAPLFGRNLVSVLFTDLINIFAAPSGPNLLALLVDSLFFVIFPLVGGIMNMSVLYNYELDPVTFQNSGLVKQDLYVQLMQSIKDYVFEVIGRPRFFDKDFSNDQLKKPKYKSPNDIDLDEIYVEEENDVVDNLVDEVVVFEF